MIAITKEPNGFRVRMDYDPVLVDAIKQIRGRKYDPETRSWTLPASAERALAAFTAEFGGPGEESAKPARAAKKHAPTLEQREVIQASLENGNLKVNAVAGSGKTSTCVMVAEASARSGLYLAFNTATAEEAKAKFPSRIKCATTHSVAYGELEVGKRYAGKLNRPADGPRVNRGWYSREMVELLGLPQVGCITPEAMAGAVRRTLQRFQQSADEALILEHTVLPRSFEGLRAFLLDVNPAAYSAMSDTERHERLDAEMAEYKSRTRELVLKAARELWELRTDPWSPVMMDHDTYLKSMQLKKLDLRQPRIILDEAQDSTDCVIDLILHQAAHGSQIILVGDKRQQLYSWRGAVNAMAKVEGFDEYPLSQSWRYGPAVAAIAESILEHDMIIRGNPALDTRIEPVEGAFTWLFRTNAALLSSALPLLAAGRPVCLNIDVKPFAKRLDSAYQLFVGGEDIRDPDIREYGTWETLLLEKSSDPELSRIVRLIEEDPDAVPAKVELLEHYRRPAHAEITMSTAHKSKGLEWAQVRLAADFPSPYEVVEGQRIWRGLPEGEQNLLYVAATRATHCLEINQTVRDILAHERGVQP